MNISDALLAAYCRTSYRVLLPQGEAVLRIGDISPELDTLLRAHGQRTWVFVTAHNPGSKIDEAGNAARHAELLTRVEELGLPWFAGRGVADSGDWPPEESMLILGLSQNDARALGRAFGQLAIVVGELGGPARLLSCDTA